VGGKRKINMIVEFYPIAGSLFKREMFLPLPPTYRIALPSKPIVGMFWNIELPPKPTIDYMEFELAIIKYTFHPSLPNVVGLPRKAYRERKI
jgi:hypothetical protein